MGTRIGVLVSLLVLGASTARASEAPLTILVGPVRSKADISTLWHWLDAIHRSATRSRR